MPEATLRCIACNHELIHHPEKAITVPLYHCKNSSCMRWGLITMVMRFEGEEQIIQDLKQHD